jgi:hypothetical protein
MHELGHAQLQRWRQICGRGAKVVKRTRKQRRTSLTNTIRAAEAASKTVKRCDRHGRQRCAHVHWRLGGDARQPLGRGAARAADQQRLARQGMTMQMGAEREQELSNQEPRLDKAGRKCWHPLKKILRWRPRQDLNLRPPD